MYTQFIAVFKPHCDCYVTRSEGGKGGVNLIVMLCLLQWAW